MSSSQSFLFFCRYTFYHFKKLHSSDILPLVSCYIKLMIYSILVPFIDIIDIKYTRKQNISARKLMKVFSNMKFWWLHVIIAKWIN